MKSYLNYFKLRVITNLQYRASALAGIMTQLFFGLVYIMMYLAFYESNDTSNVMNWNQLVTYMWLQQAFFALTYPFMKDNDLLEMIKNGNLAYELVRPQNFYLKFFIKMIAERFVSTFLRFIPVLVIGLLLPYPYSLSLPHSFGNFIIFIISLILACLLITSLSLIVHIITMFTMESRGVITTYSTIAEVFMGTVIPLPFFPAWLSKIASYLPFRYIGDFPYRVYSNSITINEGLDLLLGSVIWIIITMIIGALVSKFALKKAVIQGG